MMIAAMLLTAAPIYPEAAGAVKRTAVEQRTGERMTLVLFGIREEEGTEFYATRCNGLYMRASKGRDINVKVVSRHFPIYRRACERFGLTAKIHRP